MFGLLYLFLFLCKIWECETASESDSPAVNKRQLSVLMDPSVKNYQKLVQSAKEFMRDEIEKVRFSWEYVCLLLQENCKIYSVSIKCRGFKINIIFLVVVLLNLATNNLPLVASEQICRLLASGRDPPVIPFVSG